MTMTNTPQSDRQAAVPEVQAGDLVRWTYVVEGRVDYTAPLGMSISPGADEASISIRPDRDRHGKLEVLERVADQPYRYDSNLRMDGRSVLEIVKNGGDIHIRIYDNGADEYAVAVVEEGDVRALVEAIVLRAGL